MEMKDQIRDMVIAMANGDADASMEALNTVMSGKALDALDDMRTVVAKGMFVSDDEVTEE